MAVNAPPFVLMTSRGRGYLRLQLATPDVDDIADAVQLFEAAAASAAFNLVVEALRYRPERGRTR